MQRPQRSEPFGVGYRSIRHIGDVRSSMGTDGTPADVANPSCRVVSTDSGAQVAST